MTSNHLRRSIFSMLAKSSTPAFDHAARYVPMLNEKQMDVLRLIADGCTNAEIADALNLTLAGAKWNVSEILTKLGLDVREEAAAFYRWHTSPPHRTRRFFGGLLSWGAWKTGLATGAAALVAVVGVAATIALTSDGIEPEINIPGQPFYMEANSGRSDPAIWSNVRWWFGDATHGRLESDRPIGTIVMDTGSGVEPPLEPGGTSFLILDGANEFQWATLAPMYMKVDLRAQSQWRISGPALGPVSQQSLDEFLASFAARSGRSTAVVTGDTTLLGRYVKVVDVTNLSPDDTDPNPRSTERYWLDPARMFVMRAEISFPGQGHGSSALTMESVVTKLKYGAAQPADRFVWVTPPGVVENLCGPNVPPPIATGAFPDGFVSVPAALTPVGWFKQTSSLVASQDWTCGQASLTFAAPTTPAGPTSTPEEQPYIKVDENRENAPSMLPADRTDSRQLANGDAAYAWQDGKSVVLGWVHGVLGFQLHSNARTADELVAFANGLTAP